jgi:hypothetical protein
MYVLATWQHAERLIPEQDNVSISEFQITGKLALCSPRLLKKVTAKFKPLQSSPFSKLESSGFKSSGRYNGSNTICKIAFLFINVKT